MRFDAIVFDFDGTLVDSAPAKYGAFFELFADTQKHRTIITNILADDPDGSRHAVIPRMVTEMTRQDLPLPPQANDDQLINRYGELAIKAVAACKEIPGASELLEQLSAQCPLYVCSNTTDEALHYLIGQRGWAHHIRQASGYPASKAARVAEIIVENGNEAGRVAVVGDGVSDKRAAEMSGCPFFKVCPPAFFDGLEHWLETGNA